MNIPIRVQVISYDEEGREYFNGDYVELNEDEDFKECVRQIILEELYKHNVIIKKEID